MLAPVLAGTLLEADGSLEEAVAHSSLGVVLQDFGPSEMVAPARAVTRFLAESLYQRLVLDLGESLEAASRGYGHWRQSLDDLQSWIDRPGAVGTAGTPPPPPQWRGLAGWNWVTLALEQMLRQLRE
jgi:hypothetical protein